MKKLSLVPLAAVTIAALALVGCAGAAWPTIQNKTIVLARSLKRPGFSRPCSTNTFTNKS
jgi:hypothetical protein